MFFISNDPLHMHIRFGTRRDPQLNEFRLILIERLLHIILENTLNVAHGFLYTIILKNINI